MEYTKLRQANKIVCTRMGYTDTYIHGKQQGRSILDLAVTLGKLFMEKQQEDLRSEISAGNGMQGMLGRQKLS